jgi:hypothetical protein
MAQLSIQRRSSSSSGAPSWLRPLAQAGLISKGIVYCLLGSFAFMAAFGIGGHSSGNADRSGVFGSLEAAPGGPYLLGALALGLFCYTAWRLFEAVADPGHKGSDAKGIANRLRYAMSGLIYASIAWVAARLALTHRGSGTDSKQKAAHELLTEPAGQWLTGAAALVLIGIGIYQIWYGWSEKYRKHVPGATLQTAGKVGYTARGAVWCVLGWLFGRAALHANSAEAGDTGKAFQFVAGSWGPWVLAALGIGLVCYGVFNFIRAKHDRIGT